MTQGITRKKVQEIIRQELSRLHEKVDHEGVQTVVSCAGKLIKAIDDFNESCTPAQKHALAGALSQLNSSLEDMIETPGSYVEKQKVEPKKVSLRAVKTND